jgi:23S rRNA (cytosine1962-C5)-methyltransferase
MLRRFAPKRRILNLFSYTGAFSCVALAAGADFVINADSSLPALRTAEKNLQLNGFDKNYENLQGDGFTILRELEKRGEKFDLVILDPPKLIDSQRSLMRGCRGYQDLARLGFKLLNPGGVLFNFSCSGLMESDLFQKITAAAALDAGADARIVGKFTQSPDHPVLTSVPETFYLKGLCSVI